MTIDKQALREAAGKVNSGDWSYEEFNRLDLPGGSFVKIDGRDAVYCLNKPVGGIKQSRAVIAFIATFNPKVARALLDEVDTAQHTAAVDHEAACSLVEENEDLKRRIAELERSETQLINERDSAESALNDAYKAVMGQAPEWSNWFSFENAIDEIELACELWRNQTDDVIQFRQRIAELEARTVSAAAADVLAERLRQINIEDWKPEHDDEHSSGELAMAAVCYINETGTVNRNGGKPWGWPWDASWWKPSGRRKNLVKAGALILAEIERIDRAAGIKVKE